MRKRGQVTIFLIIGLIILILTSLILWLTSSTYKEKINTDTNNIFSESEEVQMYVENCLHQVGQNAILFIGQHGGYYKLPDVYNPEWQLPYYFYSTQNFSPTPNAIESELSDYVKENLFFCLKNFATFKTQGLEISSAEIEVNTKILPQKIKFELQLPLTISQDVWNKEIRFFQVEIPISLQSVLNFNQAHLEEQLKEPHYLCWSCLVKSSEKNKITVSVHQLSDSILLLDLFSNNSGEEYHFKYLNNYTWANSSLEIKP